MSTNSDVSDLRLDVQSLLDVGTPAVNSTSPAGSGVGSTPQQVETLLSSSNLAPPYRSLASIEDAVSDIWENALGRPIARDEDYWELGRGAMLAFRIIRQINEKIGVQLPITVLYESSTIASLAKLIYEGKTSTGAPLVLLKRATAEKPPLFIISGLGGLVLELFPVGRAISYSGAVYAIQPKGLNENDTPHNSIEEMATEYLKAIREIQPHGPYLISGYSVGGYVAIEMARLLEAQGEPVPFLGLLDSHPFEAIWPFRVWLSFMIQYSFGTLWRRLRKYIRDKSQGVSNAKRPSRHENASAPTSGASASSSGSSMREDRATSQCKRFLQNIQRYTIRFRNPRGRDYVKRFSCYTAGLPPGPQQVLENGIIVIAEYHPRRYDKEMVFFKSALGDSAQCDPLQGWQPYFANFNVRLVPGNHRSMLYGPNATALAREISICLADLT